MSEQAAARELEWDQLQKGFELLGEALAERVDRVMELLDSIGVLDAWAKSQRMDEGMTEQDARRETAYREWVTDLKRQGEKERHQGVITAFDAGWYAGVAHGRVEAREQVCREVIETLGVQMDLGQIPVPAFREIMRRVQAVRAAGDRG